MNKTIKHWAIRKGGRQRYLCNGACSVTKEKIAKQEEFVTCINCIKKLKLA